jgi:hypothetical protein
MHDTELAITLSSLFSLFSEGLILGLLFAFGNFHAAKVSAPGWEKNRMAVSMGASTRAIALKDARLPD